MPIRTAQAEWTGTIKDGSGRMHFGGWEGAYSFRSRFEREEAGTNPEELIGAAHSGCFSMALSMVLEQAGYPPQSIHTGARVHLDKVGDGFRIMRIDLHTEARVPGIDEQTFRQSVEKAKQGCPVSQALAGVEIHAEGALLP